MEFDELPNRVIDCAIEVHRELDPVLLESTYERRLLPLGGCSKQDRLLHPPSALRVLRGETILYLHERHRLSPVRSLHSPSRKGVATPSV